MKSNEPGKGLLQELICSKCGKAYSGFFINTFSPCCKRPLLARYDLFTPFSKDIIIKDEYSMWRYFRLLPVYEKEHIISLKEGMTPIISLNKMAAKKGLASLLMKDESVNPTGTFKARGLSMAVSKAKELGLKRLIIPTAGNAGVALAAYSARADMECIVVMPTHAPESMKEQCRLYGAQLVLVKGLINDCAKKADAIKETHDCFDVSTFKEPYRVEGKKTMGYEIAEQLNWNLPDIIVYPAGGGTGLIGIWKAFQEMRQLGWINGRLPKMVAVQPELCSPLAAAEKDPASWSTHFKPSPSVAQGLTVPFPFGLELMQQVIRESGGCVITVSESQILSGIEELAREEGILLSPEGSAAFQALNLLSQKKPFAGNEKLLFLNTGKGG